MRDSAEAASRTYTHSNSSTDSTDSSNRALFVTYGHSPRFYLAFFSFPAWTAFDSLEPFLPPIETNSGPL